MDDWLTDTPPSARFPLYTRANADEVGPLPFHPLTWTLGWERGAVPGTVDGWVHLGGFRREEFQEPVAEVYGCWGGYFYNQVSVGRVFGMRAPGGTPDDIDRTYFGANPEVPPYQMDPRDVDEELSASLGQTLAGALSSERLAHADELVATAASWAALRPDLDSLDDAGLVAAARAACEPLRYAWDVYIQVIITASVPPGVVHMIASSLGRSDDVGVFTALGEVESARTNAALWELSRAVRGSATLTAAFDTGQKGLADRLAGSSAPEVTAFRARLDGFLATWGHRGPNEYDLASDTWATAPSIVLELIGRIRLQDDAQSPARRAAAAAEHQERVTAELTALVAGDEQTSGTLAAAIRAGTMFYRAREATKDALVRAVHEVRLPLRTLALRAAERGDIEAPGHLFQLLDAELDAFVADPGQWKARLAERAAEFVTLADRMPPYTVMHGKPIPPIDSWPLRSGAEAEVAEPGAVLTGVSGSPGEATGRARVVAGLDDVDDLEPGDVLVCTFTDPSWTPLIMAASAVVCEVGAPGSHAAIVSRELGVPCVVGVQGATRLLAEGATVRVDGTAGAVTVLPAVPAAS